MTNANTSGGNSMDSSGDPTQQSQSGLVHRQTSIAGQDLASFSLSGNPRCAQDFASFSLLEGVLEANFGVRYPQAIPPLASWGSTFGQTYTQSNFGFGPMNANLASCDSSSMSPSSGCAQRSLEPYRNGLPRIMPWTAAPHYASVTGPVQRPGQGQEMLPLNISSYQSRQADVRDSSQTCNATEMLRGNAYEGEGDVISSRVGRGQDSGPASVMMGHTDKKQHLKCVPLPSSLAKSFDPNEMEKIARAIFRVNEFGSSSASDRSCREGLSEFTASMDGGRSDTLKKVTSKVIVGTFTVQCSECMKWRIIPTKEQYERIRQSILEKPFYCSSTGGSCNDPPELSEDMKQVWAIDKPNIPAPPDGWERKLVIRSAGCSKFADIYYISPRGKKLRSMPEIERYLAENLELVKEGVSLTQFSFAIPKALDENYCRKKSSTVMRGSITHKGSPMNSLGVRAHPFKALPHWMRVRAELFQHSESNIVEMAGSNGQPGGEETSSLPCIEQSPFVVEPLRVLDRDSYAMMADQGGLSLPVAGSAPRSD